MVQKDKIFAGVDLSYSDTGVVLLNEKSDIIEEVLFQTNSKDSYEKRISDIYNRFDFIPKIIDLQMVNIEGLSFGSKGKLAELGALHYFFRIQYMNANIPYEIISPKSLKKYITGKGNAKKEIMIKEVYKKWGVDYNNNNLADAYSLAKMATDTYNLEVDKSGVK